MTTTVLRFVGGVGSGKTTALRAFAEERNAAGVKCLYVAGGSTVQGILQELGRGDYKAVLIDDSERGGDVEGLVAGLLESGLDHIVVSCARHPAEVQRDELLKALEKLAAVAKGCEQIASSYSGCIDGVEEHGGDDHEDPSCAIFHRLYYAMFDAKAAIAKAKDGAA